MPGLALSPSPCWRGETDSILDTGLNFGGFSAFLRHSRGAVSTAQDACVRRRATDPLPSRIKDRAPGLAKFLVCRLVGLQFRQRPYHRSDFALWPAAAFSPAADEIEALAKVDHPFRGYAGDAGWIQSHCSWPHCLSDVIAAILLGVHWLMICALLLKPMRWSLVAPVAIAVEEPRLATAATAEGRASARPLSRIL